MCLQIIYLINMYKKDLALNNLQPNQILYIWYICTKFGIKWPTNGWFAIKPNETNYILLIYMYKEDSALNNL